MTPGFKQRLRRRQLLAATSMAGVAQFLPVLRPAHAEGAKPPRRLILFFTWHGTLPWLWRPQGTRTDFTMGPLLAPLEPFKKEITLIGGVNQKQLHLGQKTDNFHAVSQSGLFTGQLQMDDPKGMKSNGISIDVHVVEGLKAKNGGISPTPLPYLHMGMTDSVPLLNVWGQPYHLGPGRYFAADYDPRRVFARMFPTGKAPAPTSTAPDPEIARRRSVLDFAYKQFQYVKDLQGTDAAKRLDENATMVRDLEQRLDGLSKVVSVGASCKTPDMSALSPADKATSQFQERASSPWWDKVKVIVPNLMQAAVACDLTRVMAIQLDEPASADFGYKPGDLNIKHLHDLVHKIEIDKKGANQADILAVAQRYYTTLATNFANVLGRLRDLKEADGSSALSNSAVLWATDIAEPAHAANNAKWVLAGGCGGYLKTGQFLDYMDDSRWWFTKDTLGIKAPTNGEVLATIANAMGVPTAKFGHPLGNNGELSDLRA